MKRFVIVAVLFAAVVWLLNTSLLATPPWLWGWPDRFAQRMKSAGSEIILLGPYAGGDFTTGIDSAEDLELVPETFSGYVWTNRAETTGPMLAKRQPAS
ncbi:hypothetical protein AC244_00260 [Ensifer adhaerens]|uniref:Uncharacterized protein n=1 Tax=Ensifer adhaerens TaxID=106592 RepID=A0A0L8C5G6_ENSAD|nr:hypothetical protein AC244_00260 [Ensifer adhaerens]